MIFGEIDFRNKKLYFFERNTEIKQVDFLDLKSLKNLLSSCTDKIIAVGFLNAEEDTRLNFGSEIWLELDIVPVTISNKNTIYNYFDELGIVKINIDERNKVLVEHLVEISKYTYKNLESLSKKSSEFSGKVLFISATSRGGGVALMRHSMMRLTKQLNLDWDWHILEANEDVFQITKRKFHNILQNVADPTIEFTQDDENLYEDWIENNYRILRESILVANIIVIEDPQPSGLIKHIKKENPDCKIIYRSHIQIDTEKLQEKGSVNRKVWNYLYQNIQFADKFVSHPIEHFVPDNIPKDIVVEIPATTDPLDGLNKKIEREIDKKYYFDWFNRILVESNFTELDLKQDYIIQVARFDPSKGIHDVLESFRILAERFKEEDLEIPQLVIVGHGSIDDPDGAPIFNMVMSILEESSFDFIRNKIKVARLPHSDQMLNVLLSNAKVALQLSHKEGFEIKVTEALTKGVPVVAYRTGGIPLQIINDTNGILIDGVGDTDAVTNHLYNLLVDSVYYERIRIGARNFSRNDLFTLNNIERWLDLFTRKL